MLNGIAPIIIFNFSKNLASEASAFLTVLGSSSYPLLEAIKDTFPLPPIPLYLDEKLTGIYIESSSKNIDISTTTNTAPDGKQPEVVQKGINSTVTINMFASRDSVGLAIFNALCDQIFQKVTSKEYSVTYISGAMTVFNGLLEDYSVEETSDNNLYKMTLKISKANSNSTVAAAATAVSVPVGGAPIP